MTGARAALERYRADPVAFVREVLRFEAWSKQAAVLESVRDHKRTAVRSCHGAGKSAVAARAALWYLSAFPGSRVITTAPTRAQLRDVLWREIRSAFHASGGFLTGELSQTRLEIRDDWFAVGLSTDEPERFQGHHAEHLLLVVDEASGVGQEIFEAASGFLTSPGARLLMIGNPTRTSGEFYDAFHRQRGFYNTIAISAEDTPALTGEAVSDEVARALVSREWVEEHRRKWGEASPIFQVRALGQFPTSSDRNVCSLADVEAAQTREVVPGSPVVVACDVARYGSDQTVIVVRRGNQLRVAKSYGGQDTMRTAGEILRVARETVAAAGVRPVLVVDDAGVGGGVTDRLREVGEFPVHAFTGAARARDRGQFPNRRSEAWFGFGERLGELDLPVDEELAGDLVAPEYGVDSMGRWALERKDDTKRRLGRSPDRGDAATMAFAIADRVASAPVVESLELTGDGRLGRRRERLGALELELRRARSGFEEDDETETL